MDTEAVKENMINEVLLYVIADTAQSSCYDNNREISFPETGEPFYGQDAQFDNAQSEYIDNGDETITNLNTGLMWRQTIT